MERLLHRAASSLGLDSDEEGKVSDSSSSDGEFDEDEYRSQGVMMHATTRRRVKPQSYDIEALEAGTCSQAVRSEHLAPLAPERRTFRRYQLVRNPEQGGFYLYDESLNSFALSAKWEGDSVFISQQKSFPDNFWGESQRNNYNGDSFIAVIRLDRRSGLFRLYSTRCEGCDSVLGLHTCGGASTGTGRAADRQLLLEVAHLTKPVMCAGRKVIDCNAVKVSMPSVFNDLSRECWCSRFGRGNERRQRLRSISGSGRSLPGKLRKFHSSGSDCSDEGEAREARQAREDKAEAAREEAGGATKFIPPQRAEDVSVIAGNHTQGQCVVNTVVPRFDKTSGSLKMKFLDRRVKAASSKNFVFCLDKNSDQLSGAEPMDDESRVVGQFGKVNDDRFNLDVKFPFSPLQAFAMAISLFQWQAGGDDE